MGLIPMDDHDGWIWMDGAYLPWREAKLHVLTHGLHYGSCVFEGERAYNGRVFKSRQHSERLHKSASILGYKLSQSVDQLEAIKYELLKRNNLTDAYIRPVAWRGEEMGVSTTSDPDIVHMAVAAWQWPSYFSPELREKGIKMIHADYRRPAPDCAPTAAKAAGLYMICTISKNKASAQGANDALMLDYRGLVAEATGANFFMVKDGRLHTPTPDCFLNGITRQTVMDLARQKGIEVIERAIKPEEVTGADECFLTGTAAEIMGIGQIGDVTYTVGPVTRMLRETYEALVRAEGAAAGVQAAE
jgi:branched-chain amino acid aminotransferase